MTDLSKFTPLGAPTTPVVCRDKELAQLMGTPPLEYDEHLNDGSRAASYREYEMWHLGRKYAHELHLGLLQDNAAMAEANELAETTRFRVGAWKNARCWSPDKQRSFLDVLAGGVSVTEACDIVEMSKQSAYRHRARDRYFAVAWDAALELARPRVLEDFVERARTGQLETWKRIGPDGKMTIVERRRYDNTHALRVLDRLERTDADAMPRDERVDDAVEDFDGRLEALGTPDAEARLTPPEPEVDMDMIKAEVERYLNDPLPHMGDSDFANSLREVYWANYDEDEEDDEAGDIDPADLTNINAILAQRTARQSAVDQKVTVGRHPGQSGDQPGDQPDDRPDGHAPIPEDASQR